MVADETRVVIIEETVGAVVESQANDRHIVGVHHAVCEANLLPLANEFSGAQGDFPEQLEVAVGYLQKMRVVVFDNVIGQRLKSLELVTVIEDFE